MPAPALESLHARAFEVDALLTALWPAPDSVALVAVGGYGRRELFPFSDIDLLFVGPRPGFERDLAEPIAAFLRALWDAGLRVSQSVHALEECLHLDERNVELAVSLLDRRFLLGGRALFDALRDPPHDRLAPALARLTRRRHAGFANTVFHLEPNVKESPGALRDLDVLRWMSQLGINAGAALPESELLVRLRSAMHQIAHRDSNVLNFALQDSCSAALGFSDPANLMRAYYSEARPLFRACLRRLDEVESRRSPLFAALRDRADRLSNASFSVVAGLVYFRVPPTAPREIAALFEFVARHGLALARDTEDRVARFSPAEIAWSELRSILSLPYADAALRAMHDTGFLVRLFPALLGIQSLVVRDFYHRYTVDEHTLVALEIAARLHRAPDLSQELSRFAELARETPGFPLLLLALLFHDSGKGRPEGNHSEASAAIAADVLDRLGADPADRDIVLYLIRNHLLMSRLMLTRDLADPATAAALASSVQTLERLKLLTVLTCCDIGAVNPEAFTPWRATLLWQLYAAAARRLTEDLYPESPAGMPAGLPARYALTHSPEEREEHLRMETSHQLTRLDRVGAAYRLTVVALDRPFLFARAAGALAAFGMNILRAEAFHNERGFAIETFTFSDPMRTLDLNPGELPVLDQSVRDAITGLRPVEERLRGRPGSRRPAAEARIWFDNHASPRATLFEVNAGDRPGLLYDLASAISVAGCNIEVVLVDTEGRQAMDVFYVTRDGVPLDDASAAALRLDLLAALSENSAPPR